MKFVALAALLAVTAPLPRVVFAQPTIPVVALPAPVATSQQTLGTVLGIRETSTGALLVDDGGRRQLRVFDASLASSVVALDSLTGIPNAYGPRAAPIIRYLGDSSLMPDYASVALLVLDATGKVVRTMAFPNSADFNLIRSGALADKEGRLVFVGQPKSIKGATPLDNRLDDSLPLLRTDFDTRRTDTIARVARPLTRTRADVTGSSGTIIIWSADPMRTLDVWTVTSSGAVAIVRGHDYHVDWINADGPHVSTPKLPFDWRRLTDDDKRRVADSLHAQFASMADDGTIAERVVQIEIVKNPNAPVTPPRADSSRAAAPATGKPRSMFAGVTLQPPDSLTVRSMPDYYPPVRAGAAMADLDGNLWILPTTSTASLNGELVYDVVNARGALVRRVRLPQGRLLAGFGRNGAVYTTVGSIATGFRLERSMLPLAGRSAR